MSDSPKHFHKARIGPVICKYKEKFIDALVKELDDEDTTKGTDHGSDDLRNRVDRRIFGYDDNGGMLPGSQADSTEEGDECD